MRPKTETRNSSPIPVPTFVIARKGKVPTRQSSRTSRQPSHRPGIPHNDSDWIATP
jgi:hypothetical protein